MTVVIKKILNVKYPNIKKNNITIKYIEDIRMSNLLSCILIPPYHNYIILITQKTQKYLINVKMYHTIK